MLRTALFVLVVGCAGTLASAAARAQTPPVPTPTLNRPPVVTTTLPFRATFDASGVVRFKVTVTDPDGDPVNARLVNGPDGLYFSPLRHAPSGTTREIVWSPTGLDGGRRLVTFEAWDDRQPQTTTQLTTSITIVGADWSRELSLFDLDGDKRLDVVSPMPWADVAGMTDAGAIALFPSPFPIGDALQYPATLQPLTPAAGNYCGNIAGGQSVLYADVNGDGVADVIAVDDAHGGEINVWFRPLAAVGNRPPDAVLRCDDPDDGFTGDDSSGTGTIELLRCQGILVADVTHDGINDVIATAPHADTSVTNAGEICVFAGGPGMVGTPAPTAILRAKSPVANDVLGTASDGCQPLFIDDVSGDGIPDVVGVGAYAVGGRTNTGTGMLYMWKGGSGLTGIKTPDATLDPATYAYRVGHSDSGEPTHLIDVTGDGIKDVVVCVPEVVNTNIGSVLVWKGGSKLKGTLTPTAVLKPGNSSQWIGFGYLGARSQPIQFVDLDHDGINDVVVACPFDNSVAGFATGAIYYWLGGNLSGTLYETGKLVRPSPQQYDELCFGSDKSLQVADVTGDGWPDVVACSMFANTAASEAGAIDVWESHAGIKGSITSSAALEVPGASIDDWLGATFTWYSTAPPIGPGLSLVDVTGDGIPDVVASAAFADVGGVVDRGAIYIWKGGAALTGGVKLAPTATLTDPNGAANSSLGTTSGDSYFGGEPLRLIDFDEDGIDDVVALAKPTATTPGRILIWSGGAALNGTPNPIAIAASVQTGDDFGWRIHSGDVTGDGHVDLIVAAPRSTNSAGTNDAGQLYLFSGGPSARGNLAILGTLENVTATPNDETLGYYPLFVRDVDRDGIDDLVVGLPTVDEGKAWDVGAIFFWRGPILGSTPPTSILRAGVAFGSRASLGE